MAPPAAPDSPKGDAGVERGHPDVQTGEENMEVLLLHLLGRYCGHKDAGARSIPTGEIEPGEDVADVPQREFRDVLGSAAGRR